MKNNSCEKERKIVKIAITGGPCGGKSTALGLIKSKLEKSGYTVLTVAETATELISGGISSDTCPTVVFYQELQLRLQLEKEKVYSEAAQRIKGGGKVVIVCDRGTPDNKGYMKDREFAEILGRLKLTEEELLAEYDGVFHLVTAAKGALEYYTTANNAARKESPEESAELDDRLLYAWSKHPYVKVFENNSSFDNKMNRLIDEIEIFLNKQFAR